MLFILIFLTYFTIILAETQIVMSVTGEVTRGNYSYYSLSYDGLISLHLYSLSGDADLYISQVYTTPTYEPDTYCLQSSTCGVDVIHIPKSFCRPLGIGVYGHPSHEMSTYRLEVVFHYNEVSYEDEVEELFEIPFHNSYTLPSPEKMRDIDSHVEEEEDSFVWALTWSFIDIVLEVLFL